MRVPDFTYEGVRRLSYGEGEFEGATFIPVCKCGRFVKADESVRLNGYGHPVGANATCSRCGRVEMIFEGYV